MGEHRLDDLESRYSLLEQTVQALSDVVWRQQQQIDQLVQLVRVVESRLQDDTVDAARVDRPPHF